jgi:hypothetical protein
MSGAAGLGFLGFQIWPTYLGVATGHPGPGPVPAHEPWDDLNYARGQIHWRADAHGLIWGRAEIFAPAGAYTHLVYCYGCNRESLAAGKPLEQPIIFDRPGVIEIDPIVNQDYLPRL